MFAPVNGHKKAAASAAAAMYAQINAVYGSSSTGRNCLELDEAAAGAAVE